MKRFKYRAKDSRGNLVVGEVESGSEQQAAKLVRSKGLYLISLNLTNEESTREAERLAAEYGISEFFKNNRNAFPRFFHMQENILKVLMLPLKTT